MDKIKEMKKAELHIHLDGCLRGQTVIELAKSEGIGLPTENPFEIEKYLRVSDDNKSLVEYLTKFDLPLDVMQTEEALYRVAYEFIEDRAEENYIYIEVRFAPHLHTRKGLGIETVTKSVLRGLEESGRKYNIKWGLILCIMRHMPVHLGYEIVNLAEKLRDKGVCAIDLAGAEKQFPVTLFREVFEEARKKKLNITIHAGEADGAHSVKNAIECGAMRIGHGIRSIEDKEVIQLLRENNIAIEVCPISNSQTKVFEDISIYPLKSLVDLGVRATLNTDSTTVSNTSLVKEAEFLSKINSITETEIREMIKNSIIHSFASETEKMYLLSVFEKS